MTPLQRAMVESVLRKALTVAGTVLITKGWLTSSELDSWMPELVGLALIAASQGWSMFASWWQQKMLGTAAAMPAGVTKAEVAEVAKRPEAPPASLPANVEAKPMRL